MAPHVLAVVQTRQTCKTDPGGPLESRDLCVLGCEGVASSLKCIWNPKPVLKVTGEHGQSGRKKRSHPARQFPLRPSKVPPGLLVQLSDRELVSVLWSPRSHVFFASVCFSLAPLLLLLLCFCFID